MKQDNTWDCILYILIQSQQFVFNLQVQLFQTVSKSITARFAKTDEN